MAENTQWIRKESLTEDTFRPHVAHFVNKEYRKLDFTSVLTRTQNITKMCLSFCRQPKTTMPQEAQALR